MGMWIKGEEALMGLKMTLQIMNTGLFILHAIGIWWLLQLDVLILRKSIKLIHSWVFLP